MDPQELASRYVAVWTEPDAGARRAAIAGLFAEDGVHVLQPPEVIRDEAAALGFPAAVLEARGHAAVETRVARSHDRFVATGEFTFRARPGAVRLGDTVKFEWETVDVATGEARGVGLEVVTLDEHGRVTRDCMFPG